MKRESRVLFQSPVAVAESLERVGVKATVLETAIHAMRAIWERREGESKQQIWDSISHMGIRLFYPDVPRAVRDEVYDLLTDAKTRIKVEALFMFFGSVIEILMATETIAAARSGVLRETA